MKICFTGIFRPIESIHQPQNCFSTPKALGTSFKLCSEVKFINITIFMGVTMATTKEISINLSKQSFTKDRVNLKLLAKL